MAMTTTNGGPIITPEQIGQLIVEPLADAAVATRCSTVVNADSPSYRLPKVTADPSAGWVAEGQEIPVSDSALAEVIVTPSKIAALTVITRELAEDSDPSATQIVQDGLVRDLSKKIDAAWLGDLAAPAPAGLESLAGVTTVGAGSSWTSLDPFSEAQSEAEQIGVTLDSFVVHPTDLLALAQLTDEDGSRRPLLGDDPSTAGRRQVFGTPLVPSQHATPGVVWGVPRSRSFVVIRTGTELSISPAPYFTSDRVAIRVVMRVGLGFPQTDALVKITLSG